MYDRDAYSFIKNLTRNDSAEIEGYLSEIRENKDFHSSLEENRTNYGRRPFSGRGWGIGTVLGEVLYALCRKVRPDVVVETGVASGVSSSYILLGLRKNCRGVLNSIDFARWGGQSGWIIPADLRDRWQLVTGRSSDKLPPLLDRLKTIDIFLHDSEHTYRNMLFEYKTAWIYLRPGGLLLSHNIDANSAFRDFTENIKSQGHTLRNLGGLLKS